VDFTVFFLMIGSETLIDEKQINLSLLSTVILVL
jgi:hypothetical protein